MKPLLIVLVILLLGSPVHGREPEQIPGSEQKHERVFHYTAKKLGIPILKATIWVGNGDSELGKEVYRIEARVSSFNVPGFMFRMNNRFISFIKMDPFTPLKYLKQIDQEGIFLKRKNYSQTVTFDPFLHKAVVEKNENGEKKDFSFPSKTYDPLALFARYHLNENFSVDQESRISIFDGFKHREMVFHMRRSKVKSTLLGEVDALFIESTTAFSSFGEKEGNIRIWYTANGDKIPISLELDLPVGIVRFELDEILGG